MTDPRYTKLAELLVNYSVETKRGDLVAIKVHCGEWDNTAYLRPVYARTLADTVKALGGRPFVCDTKIPICPSGSSRKS